MKYTINKKIYQVNVPSDYVLSHLEENTYGQLRYQYDVKIMEFIYQGKTIGESIRLIFKDNLFPSCIKNILCKRYFRIAKRYIHEYNLTKKRNRHNQETT